jgi:shikimate dehydrogenase
MPATRRASRAARVAEIRGTTRVYGIVGDPIAHSLSPLMQNAAFVACAIDAVYVPFHEKPESLADCMTGFRACGVAGLNVTVPHKEAMVALVDELRPRARACGAVNTVIRTPGGFAGDNTDGAGFVAGLRDAGRTPRGTEALLIGAGGSARAIAHALLAGGCRRLVVANRTAARADALVDALDERRATAAGLDLLAARDELARFDVIVNCTSASLGDAALPPLPFAATRPDVLCCDLVYGKRSRFLGAAVRAGRETMDGAGMLLHQGALAFTLWTGRAAPVETMRRALTQGLRDRRTPRNR